jgi:hypothetical protein
MIGFARLVIMLCFLLLMAARLVVALCFLILRAVYVGMLASGRGVRKAVRR